MSDPRSRAEGTGDALLAAIAGLCARELGVWPQRIDEIPAGLGRRRFFRLALPAESERRSAIARVEGSEDPAARRLGIPPEPPLEPLRRFLESHGLPVPAGLGRDPEQGIDLLEDVGDTSLEQAAAGPAIRRQQLYTEACSLIVRMQRLSAPASLVPAFGRRLDAALIASKASRFVDWTLPWALRRPASPGERESVVRAFAWIAEQCEAAPARLSHRDFKAANLHLRRDPGGNEKLVMIDLQGAFLAPPEYDLVCLLRDSHVPLPEDAVTALLATTRPQLPDAPDPESFSRRFALLTLTRVGKDLSHYLHAAESRGDRRYLAFVPTAVGCLQRAVQAAEAWHPRVAEFAAIVAELPRAHPAEPRP